MRRAVQTLVAAVWLATPMIAEAGVTRFGWLYDTETIPERTVEVETWILEENDKGDATNPDVSETLLLWAPVIGITDRLELALPVELTYVESGGASESGIERYGVELRWRLADPDPVERPALAPLVRLGVKRIVPDRDAVRIESGLVIGYDRGRAHLVADLGAKVEVDGDGNASLEGRPGLGVSWRVTRELRLGAEGYAELDLSDDGSVSWVAIGPNLAWTHGRTWLAASFPIGLTYITTAPRLNWAIAF